MLPGGRSRRALPPPLLRSRRRFRDPDLLFGRLGDGELKTGGSGPARYAPESPAAAGGAPTPTASMARARTRPIAVWRLFQGVPAVLRRFKVRDTQRATSGSSRHRGPSLGEIRLLINKNKQTVPSPVRHQQ